jgi:putative transposase
MVAAVFRTIFARPHAEAVSDTWDEVRDQLTRALPKIGPLMDEAKTEVLAFTPFPRAHWQKIWSTNPLERVNKEIKRRARSTTSPSPTWQSGERHYLSVRIGGGVILPWPCDAGPGEALSELRRHLVERRMSEYLGICRRIWALEPV